LISSRSSLTCIRSFWRSAPSAAKNRTCSGMSRGPGPLTAVSRLARSALMPPGLSSVAADIVPRSRRGVVGARLEQLHVPQVEMDGVARRQYGQIIVRQVREERLPVREAEPHLGRRPQVVHAFDGRYV